ncbi:MAG: O-acetyl-ADP-ribose deacetylase [Termitinemataceae bacterium]|nr:MAG: O-acetyl-ADP-ribose deacetylase [Termitinemataceae bacterium]
MAYIELVFGDITKQQTDAIVKCANATLVTGGGTLDAAIHKAAGQALMEDCKRIRYEMGGCPTGEAVVSNAYNLHCKKIIHTTGPMYLGGKWAEDKSLASCYVSCLNAAQKEGLKSIAFPCISCGTFAYPPRAACEIAIKTVRSTLPSTPCIEKVVFVCIDEENYLIYKELL